MNRLLLYCLLSAAVGCAHSPEARAEQIAPRADTVEPRVFFDLGVVAAGSCVDALHYASGKQPASIYQASIPRRVEGYRTALEAIPALDVSESMASQTTRFWMMLTRDFPATGAWPGLIASDPQVAVGMFCDKFLSVTDDVMADRASNDLPPLPDFLAVDPRPPGGSGAATALATPYYDLGKNLVLAIGLVRLGVMQPDVPSDLRGAVAKLERQGAGQDVIAAGQQAQTLVMAAGYEDYELGLRFQGLDAAQAASLEAHYQAICRSLGSAVCGGHQPPSATR